MTHDRKLHRRQKPKIGGWSRPILGKFSQLNSFWLLIKIHGIASSVIVCQNRPRDPSHPSIVTLASTTYNIADELNPIVMVDVIAIVDVMREDSLERT